MIMSGEELIMQPPTRLEVDLVEQPASDRAAADVFKLAHGKLGFMAEARDIPEELKQRSNPPNTRLQLQVSDRR